MHNEDGVTHVHLSCLLPFSNEMRVNYEFVFLGKLSYFFKYINVCLFFLIYITAELHLSTMLFSTNQTMTPTTFDR